MRGARAISNIGVTSVRWCGQRLGAKVCVLIRCAALNRVYFSSTDEIANVVDTNINVTEATAIRSILASCDCGSIILKNERRSNLRLIQSHHEETKSNNSICILRESDVFSFGGRNGSQSLQMRFPKYCCIVEQDQLSRGSAK